MDKDFSSVSPSAWLLLKMKAETTIPFAREALQWLPQPEKVLHISKESNLMYWARVLHFEERYNAISCLVEEMQPHNVLELSSGFNFRGLDMTEKNNSLHYIDTDLPGVVHVKEAIIDKLLPNKNAKSTYELLPLNVLDTAAFKTIAHRFDEHPVTVVNEGLLMYLNRSEKEILCGNIREALQQNGGCWITADIYFRYPMEETRQPEDEFDEFLDRHRVWENMFIDEADAREFFESMGFSIDLTLQPEFQSLSSFPHFMSLLTEEQKSGMNQMPKLRETWKLGLK